jgi:hypothetical protein
LLRSILFINPAAWLLYYKTLTGADVGFRQSSVIAFELREYFKPKEKIKYLAFGSSQTGAIWGETARYRDDLFKVELAGVNPVEYYLYRKAISRLRPEVVFLQLSLFDMGRKLPYETLRYAPNGPENFMYLASLYLLDTNEDLNNALKEYLVSNFFLEYKFSFLFRGYLNNYLNNPESIMTQRKQFISQSKEEKTLNQVEALKSQFSLENLYIYLFAIERFINYCADQGIKVVIAQGQFNPLAYSNENLEMEAVIKESLIRVSEKYKNAKYLKVEDVLQFTASDYNDGYHVNAEVGKKYVDKLLLKF